MTADPIDPDDWLAWEALEPEHVRRPSIGAARHPAVPSSAPTDKPAVKKPTRSRPNLHGKP
jgi:hypothetical protein